jgi:hypothetical protein
MNALDYTVTIDGIPIKVHGEVAELLKRVSEERDALKQELEIIRRFEKDTQGYDGRELDALIAEKVMGWKRMNNSTLLADEVLEFGPLYGWVWLDGDRLITNQGNWRPSERIQDAWQVVEKLAHRQFLLDRDYAGTGFVAEFVKAGIGAQARADTAPLAICLAALKAVEHDS